MIVDNGGHTPVGLVSIQKENTRTLMLQVAETLRYSRGNVKTKSCQVYD